MPDEIITHIRPCVKCGATDRYKSGDCRPCNLERQSANYIANRESRLAAAAEYRKLNQQKIKESQKAYRDHNKSKLQKSNAEYRKKNKEKISAYLKNYNEVNKEALKVSREAYRSANPEVAIKYRENNKKEIKERMKKWRSENAERIAKTNDAWAKANPNAKRIIEQNRRAKAKSSGKLSKGLAEKLFKLQKGRCACCGLPLCDDYHLDHIMPLALGGSNTDENIQLLRKQCNNQKYAKHPVDFMQERGFLL